MASRFNIKSTFTDICQELQISVNVDLVLKRLAIEQSAALSRLGKFFMIKFSCCRDRAIPSAAAFLLSSGVVPELILIYFSSFTGMFLVKI